RGLLADRRTHGSDRRDGLQAPPRALRLERDGHRHPGLALSDDAKSTLDRRHGEIAVAPGAFYAGAPRSLGSSLRLSRRPALSSTDATTNPKTNPPTCAKNAMPPPFALAPKRPKFA